MKRKSYIAIIPARKNSKRLKNKNLLKIKNKSLFNYTLEAAKKSKKIDNIIVSTNINKLIKTNSKKIFYIKRPNYLCKDHCSTESAISHALKVYEYSEKYKFDNIILLQPTSPFRNHIDIDNAIQTFEKFKYDSLISVYQEKISLWRKNGKIASPINYKINRRIRGQFMKETIVENGAIYIFKTKEFKKFKNRLFGNIGLYKMSKRNSVEIDTMEDIKTARLLLNFK